MFLRALFPCSLAFLLGALAPMLQAQAPVKPLTETELLKTIDSIGGGNPINKSPLSASDPKPGATPATKARKAKPGDPAAKPSQTEITSDAGTFDNRTHQAIFVGKVFVKNPDFNLNSDKLTAYMKAQAKAAGANAEALKANPPKVATQPGAAEINATGTKPKTAAPDDKAGGLEKAIAEGNVVITRERVDAEGNVAHDIGRGKKAVYEASTGDVTLTGKPEVQQGINTCIATDEDTIIILNRNGKMTTKGPTITVIRENAEPPTPATSNSAANGR